MGAGGRLMGKIRWIVSALATVAPMVLLLAAMALSTGRAGADQSLYVAAGIPVDLTGDIATLREKAMLQAQRDGLKKVLATIASPDALQGLQLPSDDQITGWVQDFEIEEEKSSASRYIGKFTFRFMAEPIRQFLTENNIPYAETESKAVLVLPVFTSETGDTELWGPTNPWFAAWASRPQQPGLVPIQTPVGDLPDQNAISATQALAGDQARIQSLSERYASGDVIVAEATLQPPGADGKRSLALSVIDYGNGSGGGGQSAKDQITSDTGDIDQLLKAGVDRVASLVQNSWKQENLVDPNQRNQVKVHVPFSSLQQWVEVKRHLAQVNLIKSVNLTNLSRTGADIELTYLGDEEQFVRALNQSGLLIASSGEGLQTMTLGTPGATPVGQDSGGQDTGGQNGGGTDAGSDLTQPAAPQ
jgi:Uncharacterized protein conserved in bacteria (DUF2066)